MNGLTQLEQNQILNCIGYVSKEFECQQNKLELDIITKEKNNAPRAEISALETKRQDLKNAAEYYHNLMNKISKIFQNTLDK